jgi:hypothetical protein
MANGPGGHRPHFLIDGSGETHLFSSPRQGRGAGPVPPRDRPTHAASLRAELAQAMPTGEEDAPTRLQLEFQSFEGIELATESLARDRSGIELLNVRQEGPRTFATISVPAGKIVNRRAKLTSFRRPTLTRVGRLFEGSSVSDFI